MTIKIRIKKYYHRSFLSFIKAALLKTSKGTTTHRLRSSCDRGYVLTLVKVSSASHL